MKTAIAFTVLLLLASPALADADVLRYELAVTVHPEALEIDATLELAPGAGRTLTLELAPAMEVVAMDAGSPTAAFSRDGAKLVVDRKGVPDGAPIRFRIQGTPKNRFSESRGGFLRTTVGPDIAYIRSQYPWYPRVPDEAATYSIAVTAHADWIVRTAGRGEAPTRDGDRRTWTFRAESPVRNVGLVAGPYVLREAAGEGDFRLDALVFAGHEAGADRLLATARSAFDHYAARFGPVEVDRFTIVEMPRAFGSGSGYGEDGYVLIGEGAFGGAGWAGSLVAHEIAHTWWGREVSFREFASESLASFSTLGWIEATGGEAAAREERRRAVEAVLAAVDSGKEVAFADVRGFGAGMDPATYRVTAYEKGMMLLSMAADALGPEKLDRALAGFLAEHRGGRVGWPELRKTIATGAARAVIEQWETPGIPTLAVTFDTTGSGRRMKVKGEVTQEGTPKPFRLEIPVAARAGEETETTTVKLTGRKADFRLSMGAAPDEVVLDPDWRLLVRAPRGAALDPEKVIEKAFAIVNSPKERDPAKNRAAIEMLRALLAAGAGKYEGLCHTGIGRCLFRLGEREEAEKEFSEALRLGAGGPFHVRWIHLRLGCIADLAGDRERAVAEYEKVIAHGAGDYQTKLARRYSESPYTGD